jgi:peptide/nickel transport system permease protein
MKNSNQDTTARKMVDHKKRIADITPEQPHVRTLRSMVWRQFRRHRVAMVAAAVLVVLTLAVYLAPVIAPYEFDAIDLKHVKEPPSKEHWLGTDDLGRDLLTRILYGGRISMSIGIFAALVATIFGSLVGAFAGFYGGATDNVLCPCSLS